MEPNAQELLRRFSHLAAENRLPHAILLEGSNDAVRLSLAKRLAMTALCEAAENRPCGSCLPCKKVLSDNHPDVIVVTESDSKRKTLSVDRSRRMRDDAIVKPNEGKRKIYIIPNSDTMTREGQNALLKLLEEPPSYAMFFLLCENSADLLPTIRSRTQIYTLEQQNTFSDSVCEIAVAMAAALPSPAEAELLLAAAPLVKKKDRELFHDVLCVLELILRDCCVVRCGTTQLLSNQSQCVQSLSKKISRRCCIQLLDLIRQTQERNERNLNLALLITWFCGEMRRLTIRS